MDDFRKIAVIVWLSFPALFYGRQNQELIYDFIQKDNYYSFRGIIAVNAKPDCLINLIYDFKNIVEYSSGAKSVELGSQGRDWYEVTYTYRKLVIFENRSTWRRTLMRDDHKIIFTMISTRNNLSILPELLSSTGYYLIIPQQDGCQVEYFQECTLKFGLFKESYINTAKKEAIKFLRVFKDYIDRMCD
jgi:hypothetical protein